MRRAVISLLVLLAMTVPAATAVRAEGCAPVTAEEALAAFGPLVNHGVLGGHGIVRPEDSMNEPITRAEMAMVLVSAMGRREEGQTPPAQPPFADMAGHWAAGMVTVAKAEGLVRGDTDGDFHPNDPAGLTDVKVMVARLLRMPNPTAGNVDGLLAQAGIHREFACGAGARATRAQAFVLLDQALSVPFYRRTAGPERPETPFKTDCRTAVADESADAYSRLEQHGILQRSFDPDDQSPITRFDIVGLITNAIGFDMTAPYPGGDLPFTDLPSPFAPRLAFAKEQGLVRGYPDGTFHPYETLSVSETKVLLARLLRLGPDPAPATADGLLRKAGVDPLVSCDDAEPATKAQVRVLLDRVLSVPFYPRPRNW